MTELTHPGINIYHLPNKPPFMLDRELAEIYGTTTTFLNQAANRNNDWFTRKYRFILSRNDIANCNIKWTKGHLPWAYTEEGCYLAAFVLRTDAAKQQRERIVQVFKEVKHGDTTQFLTGEARDLLVDGMRYRLEKQVGKSRVMNSALLQELVELKKMGMNSKRVARYLRISKTTVNKYWSLAEQIVQPLQIALPEYDSGSHAKGE